VGSDGYEKRRHESACQFVLEPFCDHRREGGRPWTTAAKGNPLGLVAVVKRWIGPALQDVCELPTQTNLRCIPKKKGGPGPGRGTSKSRDEVWRDRDISLDHGNVVNYAEQEARVFRCSPRNRDMGGAGHEAAGRRLRLRREEGVFSGGGSAGKGTPATAIRHAY
jgi:hypothetical protein